MGSPRCEYGRAAFGEEEVEVRLTHDFEIGELEVSQREWTSLGISNPSGVGAKGDVRDCMQSDCPVGHVTWYAAAEYANRLSASRSLEPCYTLHGCRGDLGTATFECDAAEVASDSLYNCSGYRLPTDAEWEYVARAGTKGPFFLGTYVDTGGSNGCKLEPALAPAAWYCFNAELTTHPRGEKQANGWGVRDVLGNAYEWTSDPFIAGPRDATKPLIDPGDFWTSSSRRSVRGGGYSAERTATTASKRLPLQLGGPSGPGSGFRLARTLAPLTPDAGTDAGN